MTPELLGSEWGFCETNAILNQFNLKSDCTNTGKYANEYYKTKIGKIFNTKSRKTAMVHFPIVEKNFIYLSLWYFLFLPPFEKTYCVTTFSFKITAL